MDKKQTNNETNGLNISPELMDNIPGGMIIFRADESSEILYANRRALELYECATMDELRELTGGSFIGGVYEEDRYRAEKTIWNKIDTGKKDYDHVVFRIVTKYGNIRQLDDFGRLVEDPVQGFVFYVFLADNDHVLDGYQARKDAFSRFMRDGEATDKKPGDPGYKAYLYFNLSKSLPVLKFDGTSAFPKEQEQKYTYDHYYDALCSRMNNEEDRRNAEVLTRSRLLTLYHSGKRTLQQDFRYRGIGGWINIHTDFSMAEDPDTGDVILLVQIENNTSEILFEKMIGFIAAELFERLIYIDAGADEVLFVEHQGTEPVRTGKTLSEAAPEVCSMIGILPETKEELLRALRTENEDELNSGWTFVKEERIKRAMLREIYKGSGQYVILISDITEQIQEFKTKEEGKNPYLMKSSALAHEYFTVMEIDVRARTLKPYKIYENTPQPLLELIREGDYDKVHKAFVRYMVAGRYQKTFAKNSSLDFMAARLSEIPTYDYFFESSSNVFTKFRVVRMEEIDGEVTRMIIGFSDCDQEVRNYNKVYQESLMDELTGLYNRFGLREDFNSYPGREIVVAIMDIDEFRQINDLCGHDAGDAALREYSILLRKIFTDLTIYRYGSDEFMMIGDYLPNSFEQNIAKYEEGLESMTVPGTEMRLSASVGYVTAFCESNDMLRHMIKAADINLYKVKNNGKNGVFGCIYTPNP